MPRTTSAVGSTQALYRTILGKYVVPRWGEVAVSEVDHGQIQSWVATLVDANLSPSHVRDITSVISGILCLAVRDRSIPSNPATDLDLP